MTDQDEQTVKGCLTTTMMKMSRILVAVALLLGVAASAAAQSAVFVVRHAERADTVQGGNAMMAADPELSEAGRARAESLAAMLKDAGITAIFTTQYKRTKQTAEPLARALGITIAEVNAKELNGLPEKIRAVSGNVLVVGHSNTVPATLNGLGIANPPAIAETEFDNLFIVTLGEKPTMVRLRYP
jgi:phosphohistidine phosphatase SixA